MKYRKTLTLILGCILFLTGFTPGPILEGKKFTTKPNVLFISVDDLKPKLGCYGDTLAISPNIDRLASMGTLMMANYCQQAVCAPSRISLFTGMRPDYTGVRDLQTNMRDINPDILTLPEYFKNQGYQVYGFGKLMHGARNNDPRSWTEPVPPDPQLPYAEGYEYPANGQYQGKASLEAYQTAQKEGMNWGETNRYMKKQGARPSTEFIEVPDDAYRDGAATRAGLSIIEKSVESDEPFFLAIGLRKPHLPFAAPKKYYDLYNKTNFQLATFRERAENSPDYAYTNFPELRNYSDIPGKGPLKEEKQLELIRGYYSCVSYADAQVGKLLNKLESLDLLENTIIVLWGDHGWHLGDHGLWCKHTNFEQATHSPLLFYSPKMKGGKKSYSLTEFVDVFPTICELSGLEPIGNLHGKSLVPIMKNPEQKVKDYSISQYPRGNELMGYSLRTERYRLTLWMKGGFLADEMAFSEEYIDSVELYDYKTDPLEKESFADYPGYKEVKESLMGKMKEYFEEQL